jgi:hypothetical protein
MNSYLILKREILNFRYGKPPLPAALVYRSGFGFHSRASFCASAIWTNRRWEWPLRPEAILLSSYLDITLMRAGLGERVEHRHDVLNILGIFVRIIKSIE